jgi:hypothetical protein
MLTQGYGGDHEPSLPELQRTQQQQQQEQQQQQQQQQQPVPSNAYLDYL